MYTNKEKQIALELYDELYSVSKVVQTLEYPSRKTMYCWIYERDKPIQPKLKTRGDNTPEHPRNPSLEVKINALHRCFELGEDIQYVSEDIGYSRASIYTWRRKYLRKGTEALMNKKNVPRGKLTPDKSIDTKEMNELKTQVQDMQLEIDILKETIEVLKKDPGIDLRKLYNKEKVVIIDALKDRHPLPALLKKLQMPKSSYYYHQKRLSQADKYADLRVQIKQIFNENSQRYGYRRIHASLIKQGDRVSEKVVRRIMIECELVVPKKKAKKYTSYKGEISKAVPNILNRNFHANSPNQKWLTDITEFAIPAGKVYLSPIVDCFDGYLPSWRIGTTPDSELVNSMLDEAISNLRSDEHPLIHTDRGCQYRWSGWISRMNKVGLQRSMSRKGCSPDNSACEGFFGRLKNEMFYNHSWLDVSIEQFIDILNDYLIWYNNDRIKLSLGNMSPVEYRHSLGLTA